MTALAVVRGSDRTEGWPELVQVRPAQATTTVGQTVRLNAVLLNDDGSQVQGQRFHWWSPHPQIATVDSNGIVTGVGPGTVAIAAITADRRHSGFADVSVRAVEEATSDSPPAPDGDSRDPAATREAKVPSGRPVEPGPNEPPGLSFVVDRPFETYDENGWVDRHHGGSQQVSDGVARITYRAGFVGGSAPGASWVRLPHSGASYETVYVSFEYLLSHNWQGHPSHMNKIWYFSQDGATFATVKAKGGPGASAFPIQVTSKKTANAVNGQANRRNINPNLGGPGLNRGRRSLVEIVITMNSSANIFDGELHVWIDGVKTHEYEASRGNGIKWWDANPKHVKRINGLKWAPVWGGTGSAVSATMYAELSQVYVSGR